ncbi:2',3'-cyclic-nucleotide 3'-phosphodiesterase [Bimuria novae-zelandiae CBS 107.79]|uniref:2',3'-cyclic-nucleotide 3'-phosphodiesterase n=1 Tax=Bimuria novae-zelandiae CBS 107.79 TaxID=1447943 RepID=A0A6A5V5L2_9PLEO|nr:2',3'-cyclic-nucleotide 3'-phosphodiesterase [Bimuria novae-zelandiae CBS 107.79]
MPESSLWLLPPRAHRLDATLSSLIRDVGTRFGSTHVFLPHVTLTSEIAPSIYAADPQAWLDALPFPKGDDVSVKLGRLASEDVFVRKLYSRVEKEGVRDLGRIARAPVEEAKELTEKMNVETWVEERWTPHLSLLYHDRPKVEEERIREVERVVEEAGVNLDGEGEMGGWRGGRVVLVETSKPIEEWVPIAEREL